MSYIEKLYKYLLAMENGEIVIIDSICEEENKDRFVRIIKDFIDMDIFPNFVVEFNSTYSKIRKRLCLEKK